MTKHTPSLTAFTITGLRHTRPKPITGAATPMIGNYRLPPPSVTSANV